MKKLVSLLIAAALIISCLSVCVSAEDTDKSAPVILIHGMMGWGEDSAMWADMPYFGMAAGSLPDMLRAEGYTVVAPSVAPMGSCHDRCCELYAKLTGTVVDYGEAHSAKYGHERYGRDYTGQALLGEDWDFGEVILVGHSFGGPTVKAFASLCAYGSAEEREASGDDVSPLFEGGHADAVKACVTFCGPLNGSVLANLMNDTPVLATGFVLMMNILNVMKNSKWDFMLDQWGIQNEFNIGKAMKLLRSGDHCGYEMTLRGAKEMLAEYPDSPGITYVSYAACMTEENDCGYAVVNGMNVMTPTAMLTGLFVGRTVDGEKIGKEWGMTDGLVPLPSARCPRESEGVEWTPGEPLARGVWNMTPVRMNATHGYGCSPVAGETAEDFLGMYTELLDCVNG